MLFICYTRLAGLPIPIVAISVGILRNDYRTANYCWIKASPTSAAIWTFVVPMVIILLVGKSQLSIIVSRDSM